MPANGSLGRVIAVSALALACTAAIGFWSISTPTLAGDRDGPVAFSISSFFGEGAFLGVSLEEETEQAEGGARVTHVVDDSAADEAGLEEGDVIVRFDGSLTTCGSSEIFVSLASTLTGSRNSNGELRWTRNSNRNFGSAETAACRKPWSSNQSAFPICTNRAGACRMKSSSWSLKRYSKSAKNALCPPGTRNG